jgi:N-acetylmuramoyl-L-alanine amidase
MPSILTELGYLTNPLEEAFLGSEKGQDYLARAMFRGLRKYKDDVEGTRREYADEFERQEPLENENIRAGFAARKKTEEDSLSDDDKTVVVSQVKDSADDKTEKARVTDSKYAEIPLKKTDSLPVGVREADTAVSAGTIVAKYKKDNGDSAGHARFREQLKTNLVKRQVVYCVQFASTDVALNLKQGKFSAIVDADFYKADNILKYTSGKFSNIKDATGHKNLLREKGFKDCFVIAMKNGQRIDLEEAKKITGE